MTSLTKSAITGPRSLRDPRSREYAIQTMRSLKRFLESKTFDAQHIEQELQLIRQYKHWEICGFETLDAYLQAEVGITHKQLARRLAQDLAADPTVLRLATDEEAKLLRAEGGKKGGRGNLSSITTKVNRGAEYLVRRLKRDYPEIAEALARGEYRSARAAAIAAGIIKPKPPLQQVQQLLAKMTKPDRRVIWQQLKKEFG